MLAANIAARNALNKAINSRPDTKPIDTEALKTGSLHSSEKRCERVVGRTAAGFEREEEEAKAQGRLTPQECYAGMAADYADALEKYKLVCDAYGHIVRLADRLDETIATLLVYACWMPNWMSLSRGLEAMQQRQRNRRFRFGPSGSRKCLHICSETYHYIYCFHRAYHSHHMRQFV